MPCICPVCGFDRECGEMECLMCLCRENGLQNKQESKEAETEKKDNPDADYKPNFKRCCEHGIPIRHK